MNKKEVRVCRQPDCTLLRYSNSQILCTEGEMVMYGKVMRGEKLQYGCQRPSVLTCCRKSLMSAPGKLPMLLNAS